MVESRKKTTSKTSKKPIEQYKHKDKERVNNPPVGLVTPETDKEEKKKTYTYDPHLDPRLVWAGKAERLYFDVDAVSIHFEAGEHERIGVKIVDDRGIESLKIVEL